MNEETVFTEEQIQKLKEKVEAVVGVERGKSAVASLTTLMEPLVRRSLKAHTQHQLR